MSSSLIGCPIHSALCLIEAKELRKFLRFGYLENQRVIPDEHTYIKEVKIYRLELKNLSLIFFFHITAVLINQGCVQYLNLEKTNDKILPKLIDSTPK